MTAAGTIRRFVNGLLRGEPPAATHAFDIAVVGCAFDGDARDPEALLSRYHSLVEWADALANAGAGRVIVVQRFRDDRVLRRGAVAYHFVSDGGPPFPSPAFWGRRVARVLRALNPAIVHLDGLIFPAFVRHLRMSLPRRTTILVQDHGGIHERSVVFRSPMRRTFFRWGLRAADGFLFTTRDQAVPWQRAGIIGRSQPVYEVLESSTDLASRQLPSSGERRLPGRPAVLWVGKLDSNKDPLTVLEGFEKAIASFPDAALTLVFHEARLLPEVTARIATAPALRSRVHLLGAVDREALPPLYASADLFVLGSHHEGAGYALIEALSFGVTPVVTDIPSFRVLTDGGQLGALFAPGDPVELARALERLGAADFAARRQTVRAHFERELSWTAVARSAVEVYRAASAARRQSTGRRLGSPADDDLEARRFAPPE